jgi:hypothetical protein
MRCSDLELEGLDLSVHVVPSAVLSGGFIKTVEADEDGEDGSGNVEHRRGTVKIAG